MTVTNDEKAQQVRVIMSELYESLSYGAPETWPFHFQSAVDRLVAVAVHPVTTLEEEAARATRLREAIALIYEYEEQYGEITEEEMREVRGDQ